MHTFRLLLVAFLFATFGCAPAHAAVRIKDVADVEGVRDNQLVGYGLVVGLDGSGDSLRNAPFTRQSLKAMLERLGVAIKETELNTKNVAAVMVTANLPAFAGNGSRVDVTISAMGDAKSLAGGALLVTPLMGADGQVYAVAQGPVSLGGFSAEGASGSSVKQGKPTSGRISSGGIVEREINWDFAGQRALRLSLRNPDFTTAQRVERAINRYAGSGVAKAINPTSVELTLASTDKRDMVGLVTEIEQLSIEPDLPAKVVIDENSGVVVIGQDVRLSTVAIAQGNLTISVSETPEVSQPNEFSRGGETVVVPRSNVSVDEETGKGLVLLRTGVRLRDLVDGLNTLGVSPRDLISILQALKAAGALQAEIEVM
ncbi:MAG: flagellar basal body P-ring protein FlgI [Caulobacterales bacterium]